MNTTTTTTTTVNIVASIDDNDDDDDVIFVTESKTHFFCLFVCFTLHTCKYCYIQQNLYKCLYIPIHI